MSFLPWSVVRPHPEGKLYRSCLNVCRAQRTRPWRLQWRTQMNCPLIRREDFLQNAMHGLDPMERAKMRAAQVVGQVHLCCDSHQVTLLPVQLAGARNAIADALSRRGCAQPGEWERHPSPAQVIFDQWGLPIVDFFATRHNKRLPVLCPQCPTTGRGKRIPFPWIGRGLGLVYAFCRRVQ